MEEQEKKVNDVYKKNFGNAVKEFRLASSMNQQDLAKQLDINRSALSLIENGEQQPSLENIASVVTLTNKDFMELIKADSKKVVVFDTSAILKRPQLLNLAIKYVDLIYIPQIVINELNILKDHNFQQKKNAGLCMSWIIELKDKNQDKFFIEDNNSVGSNDDKIFETAKSIAKNDSSYKVYLLTNDKDFKLKKCDLINFMVISSDEFSEYFINDNSFNVNKTLSFIDAIKRNNIEAAQSLIEKNENIDVNYKDDEEGYTALIHAVRKKKTNIVKYLLNIPMIDINCVDSKKYCFPPISHAIQNNDFEMLKLLIENGADVNYPSQNSRNPYNTPLMIAAWHQNFEMVKLLVESGACVNQQDKGNGMTPLIKALFNLKSSKSIEIIKYLLGKGADRSIRLYIGNNRYDNMTALDIAYANNYNNKYSKVIELLEKQVNPND